MHTISHYAVCITALICGLLVTSCGNSSSKNAQSDTTTSAPQTNVLEIDQLLAGADSLATTLVTIEGVCTHTCKHGARKIFLMGSDNTQTIRVESGELKSFDPQCVNHIVRVTGMLEEQRIDEAYLSQWEAQIKAQTAQTHGSGEAGCDAEKQARNETAVSTEERIADFRRKIETRNRAEGKNYLSFYYVTASSYEIQE